MPFITEELWQHLADRREGESIMYAPTPAAGVASAEALEPVEAAKEIVNSVRNIRASKGISPRQALTLNIVGSWPEERDAVIMKLAGVEAINRGCPSDPAAASFMAGSTEVCIPLTDAVDTEAELARLRKDLAYYEGFRDSVMRKLGNERFVAKAPEAVVAAERRKLADAEAKIDTLTKSIAALS